MCAIHPMILGSLFTLFGKGCDLYRTMISILQILSHPFSMQNKQAYTPEVVRRIVWAIIVDTRSYFDDIKLAEDFMEQGQHLQFPVSTLEGDFIAIKHGIQIQRHNFPAEWSAPEPYKGPLSYYPMKGGGGGYQLPPGVPSGNPTPVGPPSWPPPPVSNHHQHLTIGGQPIGTKHATQKSKQ